MDNPVPATDQLCLFLFGPMRAYVNGTEVIGASYTRRKVKALLAYLYLRRGEYILKDQLLEALWPEVDSVASASARLKQNILVLRKTLEADKSARGGWQYILERGGSYFFNTRAAYYSDLEDFDETLTLAASEQQRGATSEAVRLYERACELYRADLLQDFRYEDWAAGHAAALREKYLQALEDAAELHAMRGGYARAVQLLRRAIHEDPLRESSAIRLMEWHRRRGDHAEAIRVYQRLQARLEAGLQLQPQPEATALYEAIRRDRAVRRMPGTDRLPAAS